MSARRLDKGASRRNGVKSMSKIVEYSSKATAVRGARRAGATDALVETSVFQREGKWVVDLGNIEHELGIADVSEEDENLILTCGHSHCPDCGIHLSNGVCDFDSMVETHGSEKAALKVMKHEWTCLGCGAEWGAKIEVKASTPRGEPTRHYTNKSSIEGAVNASHALFSANPDLRRKDAIALAVENGITFYTARTQYQKWYKAQKGASATK